MIEEDSMYFVGVPTAPAEPEYFHFPKYASAPLCARFVGSDVVWSSAVRMSVKGVPRLHASLYSITRRYGVADSVDFESTLDDLKNPALLVEKIRRVATDLTARLDYQLAAYCASNLWC